MITKISLGKSVKNDVNDCVYNIVENKTEDILYYKLNYPTYMFVSRSVCIPIKNSVDSSMASSIRNSIK